MSADDPLIIDRIYSATIDPDRFMHLMNAWDSRMSGSGFSSSSLRLFGTPSIKHHIERADGFIDRIAPEAGAAEAQAAVARINTAALVVSQSGVIAAANRAAEAAFGIDAGADISELPFKPEGLKQFRSCLRQVAGSSNGRQDILYLRESASGKIVVVLLRAFRRGGSPKLAIAVSTEYSWLPELSNAIQRAFALTPAEEAVLQRLVSGETVAEIAAAAGRSDATVRSQLHSVLVKTGTRTQAELVRLAVAMLASATETAAAKAPIGRSRKIGENPYETMVLPDGRRMDFMRLGRPDGAAFLWLHGPLACSRLPRAAEAALDAMGVAMVVPIKAGYGYSSPLPAGKNAAQIWAADIVRLRQHLGMGAGPIVAHSLDFQLAIALCRADPAKVTRIIGVGVSFPLTTPEEYARLSKLARFFRANARFAPKALPFLAKAIHGLVRLKGIEGYAATVFSKPLSDKEAFKDPEIRDAIVAGSEIIFGNAIRAYDGFAADLEIGHRDWTVDFTGLDVPVTLLHGELDPNHPYETARDYCRRFPAWTLIGFPGGGHLAPLVHWRSVLRLIAESLPSAGNTEILDVG